MERVAICCLFFCCSSWGYEATPQEIAATNAALDHWSSVAQDTTDRPTEETIWELGRQIRKLTREDIYPGSRRIEVHQLIQKKLISIPGHADFFGAKIRRDKELYAAGRSHEIQGGRTWDFETLGQLPSAETVKVLGSFLNDGPLEDSPDAFNSSSDLAMPMGDNLLAARALHELKIVNPPLQRQPGSYADVHPWRLWFSQVDAGTRTFRFEGDPQSYNLSGPVSKKREHRPVDQTREGPRRIALPAFSSRGGECVAGYRDLVWIIAPQKRKDWLILARAKPLACSRNARTFRA